MASVAFALVSLLALGLAICAGLKAWRGWLELKRLELASRPDGVPIVPCVEIFELKERIRRLEAIADGER